MRKLLKRLCGLRDSRRGQTTAEYAIIVALVAVSSIAVILIFGDQIRALFAGQAEKLGGGEGTVQTPGDQAQGAVGGGMTGYK